MSVVLCYQVCSYLYSKSWETRVAAGQAVEAIAKNVKKWSPAKPEESCDGGETSPTPPDCEDWMTFDSFNIEQVRESNREQYGKIVIIINVLIMFYVVLCCICKYTDAVYCICFTWTVM